MQQKCKMHIVIVRAILCTQKKRKKHLANIRYKVYKLVRSYGLQNKSVFNNATQKELQIMWREN